LYGSEMWVMIEVGRNRIKASEMRFLRASKGLRLLDTQ